jgi:RNA polymerase sigma factor (sigma-70 family)
MNADDSITVWLEEVKSGDREAARRLWERYFPLLVRLAHKRLADVPRRLEDEEDVALSVFESFCRAADGGRFPHVTNRESLWRLLCRITHFKAVDLVRRSQAAMGDANVRGESGFQGSGTSVIQPIAPHAKVETTADCAAMVADEVQRLLQMLPEEDLRTIAVAKMDGYTNQEIAERLGCAERTIERRLKYIRAIWRKEFPRQRD